MSDNGVKLPGKTFTSERQLYELSFEESFEEIRDELSALSQKLIDLLPDVTLSPDERVERLARVIPTSILQGEYHQTARTKLTRLRRRLDELVPDPDLTSLEKVDVLVARLHELVPGDEPRIFLKLEKLGDNRVSNMGR